MDIQDLRIFTRVATLQNLSAVGSELGLTPGTISKRLQALEDDLKARMFDRTTRSIRITQEGHKFLAFAERILTEVDMARAAVSASADRPAGKLKISAPAMLSRRLVVPALVGFVEAFPDIDVHIDITDRMVNLQEEGYDAAIRAGTLSDSALIAKRLASDRAILVAAPSYLDRRGDPGRPAELASHDCLILGEQRTWMFLRGREQSSVKVQGRLHSDNGELLQHAAIAGLGILRTSEIAAIEDLASGRLVHVMPDHEMASNSAIWGVYPSAKHVMPRLRVFLDHLAEFCRATLAPDGGEETAVSKSTDGRSAELRGSPTVTPLYLHEPSLRFRGSAGS